MKSISTTLLVAFTLLGHAVLGHSQTSHQQQHIRLQPTKIGSALSQSPTDGSNVLVHIVTHSYNTQFLESIDEYFYDEKPELLQFHFDKVFDSVVPSL